jgi:hypothetical protein
MRALLLLCFGLFCGSLIAQGTGDPPATALSFSRTTSIPLNKVQLHDRALEALAATFGREPGAKVLLTDRESGTIEAVARMNFRSEMLTGREETMGTIAYSIHVQVNAGELRVVVSALAHTGNRNTARGGISVGKLMRDDVHAQTTAGLGRSNVVRVHAELRELATTKINSLLQSMEAYIRANMEP